MIIPGCCFQEQSLLWDLCKGRRHFHECLSRSKGDHRYDDCYEYMMLKHVFWPWWPFFPEISETDGFAPDPNIRHVPNGLQAGPDNWSSGKQSHHISSQLINYYDHQDVGWSVLDVALSPDGGHLVYSSWSDSLHQVPVKMFDHEHDQNCMVIYLCLKAMFFCVNWRLSQYKW